MILRIQVKLIQGFLVLIKRNRVCQFLRKNTKQANLSLKCSSVARWVSVCPKTGKLWVHIHGRVIPKITEMQPNAILCDTEGF